MERQEILKGIIATQAHVMYMRGFFRELAATRSEGEMKEAADITEKLLKLLKYHELEYSPVMKLYVFSGEGCEVIVQATDEEKALVLAQNMAKDNGNLQDPGSLVVKSMTRMPVDAEDALHYIDTSDC